jgi:hypothetical protein
MKRWMSLMVGIALVVVSCGTPDATDETGDSVASTVVATTIVPTAVTTTAAPATTVVITVAPAPTTTDAPATTLPPPPPPPPPPTTAPPTTAAPPAVYYEVANPANPTYYPGPLPGAGIYFGSGCSPGAGTLPDGIWFGDITSVSGGSFEFDLMCFAPRPVGETEEYGIGEITNSNPTLRIVPVDADVPVYVVDMAMNWVQQPYAAWHVDTGAVSGCPLEWCSAVWLYVNGGEATEIMVIWTP